MIKTPIQLEIKKSVFLVVDDFEPMRKVTSGQLRSMGVVSILTANNGSEALRLLKKEKVDIVLSDWNMPVMTGLELLNAVRADHTLSHLPFIMITAEAERHRIEEAIANGVSDLLVKPYTADRLTTHIERALTAPPRTTLSSIATVSATSAKVPAETMPGTPPARPTILLVDDTADNLLLLSNLFKDDYRVRLAHSGGKALDICQSNDPPDLVLLDIMMPGIDGFEVARRMREHPTSEAIPVIFVTAMAGNDARLRGLELGAVDFVTKPIDPEILKPRVRNFMRYVEQRKQIQAAYQDMLDLARLREDVEHITRHDLKGPLAGVIGLVQELISDDSMNRKHVEQLHIVEETALQVLDMINLSAELFKIETGRFILDAKPVRIGNILRRIVEIAHATFAEKHLAITVTAHLPAGAEVPQVLGDAMLCYSLFQNLLKNACEAAPDKSTVAIVLNAETPLRITIGNQGVVPVEIRERFFHKFITSGKEGGTGLGTYSARLLAEAQHGKVSLDVSDNDKQTTLTVTLPKYPV
jgi:two-component system, sensor histidine kinase and response regulator